MIQTPTTLRTGQRSHFLFSRFQRLFERARTPIDARQRTRIGVSKAKCIDAIRYRARLSSFPVRHGRRRKCASSTDPNGGRERRFFSALAAARRSKPGRPPRNTATDPQP
ncbi:hypothetical protein [Lysobacter antibioticus]|uniref:hypothetical protein n=1 Tax=Lysobacter antibioticus TaxID=84531 RepID=UPI0011874C19|nr:hypothetical protein [Lysobacter antibioticus]